MTACDRFERAHLADLLDEPAGDAELAAHLEGCAACRARRAGYARIAGALAELGTGAERRSDHVARVLATAARAPARGASIHRLRRAAPLIAPLLGIAAAIAAVWWWRRGPEPPRFAIEIVAQGAPAVRGDARLGDRLRVTAAPGAALWIYRNDRELLRVCPRDCHSGGGGLVAEIDLDAVGRYQIVWLSTDRVPPPVGDVERDVAAGRAAGAMHELREIEVQ